MADATSDGGQRKYEATSAQLRAGFTAVPNLVLLATGLSGNAKTLYGLMRHFAWSGEEPELPDLGALLGGGKKTAMSAVKELTEAGLLTTKRRGRGLTNAYLVHEPGEVKKFPEGTSRTAVGELLTRTREDPGEDQRQDKASTADAVEARGGAAKKTRDRDPLFDALATATGLRLDAMTREASRQCGIATADLRAVGAEPEQLPAAVARYRRMLPGAAVTPMAVAKHWPAIAPPAAASPPCPECGTGGGLHEADCPRARAA